MNDHPKWSLHRDEHGYADAIDRDGTCYVHLRAGTERTVCNAPALVDRLNVVERLERERDRLRERVAELERALQDAITSLGGQHQGHFDPTGESGRGCPVCVEERKGQETK